jgi:mono/diheme cytochrome c family protein
MKTFVVFSMAALILVMGCNTDQSKEIARLKQEISDLRVLASPPPGSLDKLYPPEADRPVYQISMFEMEAPFAGIVLETQRGNLQGAATHFESFKTRYLEVSRMVPEWEKAYPLQPLDELRASLETGEREKIMVAFGNVAKICADCHTANMSKAQQRYHWGDSSIIVASDPITKEDLPYSRLMQYLNLSFVAIEIDLEEGRVDNAVRSFEAFDARFQILKETCHACHETERKYYVDQSVQVLIDILSLYPCVVVVRKYDFLGTVYMPKKRKPLEQSCKWPCGKYLSGRGDWI